MLAHQAQSTSASGYLFWNFLTKAFTLATLQFHAHVPIGSLVKLSKRTALRLIPHWLQALGPRTVPSKQAVEAELAALSTQAGDDSGFDDYLAEHQTALAKDPADYFGFVG